MKRRLPVGVEIVDGRAHARVWAPRRTSVWIEPVEGAPTALERERDGYFSGWVDTLGEGSRYFFRLDDESRRFPDPTSRFQPEGPHGPSQVVDASLFRFRTPDWKGRRLDEAVIYELHIGTFSEEGTWNAAEERLEALAEVGVTVIEVMPIAEFAGTFGWGYDGVSLFAPYHRYGSPDDVRRFVDRAHALGIAVILDVVYNHCGADGCYLREFSEHYFTKKYETDWGDPLSFDEPESGPVREFFLANVAYWIDEFQFDGLRLDATQNIYDFGDGPHIIAEMVDRVRKVAGSRTTLVIAENEPQESHLVKPEEQDGFALDAVWNDDFHHSAVVALSGRNEAYYTDYRGSASELAAAVQYGFLYQGQHYRWQKQRRGTPSLDLAPRHFVTFLENHDQVANSFDGRRLYQLVNPSAHRALLALVLLGPNTPMLFQGEEFLSSAPFRYFADNKPELVPLVRKGRREFVEQFQSIATMSKEEREVRPEARETFERCRLQAQEALLPANAAHRRFVRDALSLRRADETLSGRSRRSVAAVALTESALLVRCFGKGEQDRLIVVNLGVGGELPNCAQPLAAPPFSHRWKTIFSSEEPRFGGRGSIPFEGEHGIQLTGQCTLVLAPERDPAGRFGPLPRKGGILRKTSKEAP